MSDVIDFLERMGQDSQLRHAPEEALRRALSDARSLLIPTALVTTTIADWMTL
jgi:hypothetical protein